MSEEILTETVTYQSGDPIRTRIVSDPPRVKVKTVVLDGGFTVTIEPDALDDWEFLELIEADKFASAIKHLLGADQLTAVKEHVRDAETGRVRATAMSDVLKEIMEKVSPNS